MSIAANKWKMRTYMSLLALVFVFTGCNITKHVPDGQYLLRKNTVVLNSDRVVTDRGELQDNLARIVMQKPNDYIIFGNLSFKLWWYNVRYAKLRNRPDSSFPKAAQRPVIFDSALIPRSEFFMKSYLFNKGYFYAQVKDTTIYKAKKAYVTYTVDLGTNYLINKVNYDIDDSSIAFILRLFKQGTRLEKGKEFMYSLLEEERSDIASVFRNNGYYRFSQENITFKLDTFDKSVFRMAESPFENAVNFIAQSRSNKKPTLDVNIIIRRGEDSLAYKQYRIASVTVLPDYSGPADIADSTLIHEKVGETEFIYHSRYVFPKVLYNHIFLNKGELYSQLKYDRTNVKLNELGIFQYSRLQFRENRQTKTLDATITMQKANKYDFVRNVEVTSGSTYFLGSSLELSLINKNFLKGANLFLVSASGGIELLNDKSTDNIIRNLGILTKYGTAKSSIDFPKFLAPFANHLFQKSNSPHTIIGAGLSIMDRLDYFTMTNISANYTYTWRESETKNWSLAPSFVNIVNVIAYDSFARKLSLNKYLANTYKPTFIEGESISFRFSDFFKKRGLNYTTISLGAEEAGGLLNAVTNLSTIADQRVTLNYAQYVKFDFDISHYFTHPRATFVTRLYGGIGLPYGSSTSLPYIKQYTAGGPFSLRGWNVRRLGPGSFLDTASQEVSLSRIDRTGDIKLEANVEYRFPIAPLLKGAAKMNGAFFLDAGNIWVAQKTSDYPNGEFDLRKLYQDVAIDVGFGARFDFLSFLTLRADLAVPVKKPYVFTNNGWVVNDLQFASIVPQITIGYPF